MITLSIKDQNKIRSLSKFLSLILRHKPETIGIILDDHGWANVDEVIEGIKRSGKQFDLDLLNRVVAENDKKRFSFNDDKTKIRANQGHSKLVDVELEEKIPPKILYHGTQEKNSSSIAAQGLLKMNRLYVHLSNDLETAVKVADRRIGEKIIYEIDTAAMIKEGYKFFQSVNNVWLTDHVPPKFLKIIPTQKNR